jgi:hypothetical protein
MKSRGVAVFITCRGGQIANRKLQIANPQKFLGSFRYRQSAKILGAHSAITIRMFLQNTAQLCLKTVLKVIFLKQISCTNLNICKEKKYVFADLRMF